MKIKQIRRAATFLLLLSIFLAYSCSVYAEGSYTYNNSSQGSRNYTMGYNATNGFNPQHDSYYMTGGSYDVASENGGLPNQFKSGFGAMSAIYVYAKSGETINIGTSYSGSTADVYVAAPNNSVTSYDVYGYGVDVYPYNVGYIANWQQEKNGPKTICTAADCSAWYEPIKVTASQTGLYKVFLVSGANFNRRSGDPTTTGIRDDFSGWCDGIAAFDVTVTNSSNKAIPGRAFTYLIRVGSSSSTNANTYDTVLRVLTNDGVYYQIRFPDTQGGTNYFYSNETGVLNTSYKGIVPLYHSIDYRKLETLSLAGSKPNRIFFSAPNADLLAYLGLNNITEFTKISNFKFVGDSGNTSAVGNGGYFEFTASEKKGTYELVLKSGNTKIISFNGSITSGVNRIEWDGKDDNGNIVQPSTLTATLRTFVGETHFVYFDVEGNSGGVRIARQNATEYGNTGKIYYNNAKTAIYDAVLDGQDHSTFDLAAPSLSGTYMAWQHNAGNGIIADFWANLANPSLLTTPAIVEEEEETEYKNIVVQKTWDDQNNKFNTRPGSITFTAYRRGSTTAAGSCQANADNSWKCTISNLIASEKVQGTKVYPEYEIKETPSLGAYNISPASVVVAKDGTSAAFTNSLKTKNIIVTKSWSDQDNKFSTRPASIIFDTFIGNGTTSVGNCTANASNSWKCTISDLAIKDANGYVISYTIKERTTPSGYSGNTASVATESATTATITNTLQTKNITVTKTWSDQDNKFSTRPASIIFDAFIGNGTTSVGNCTANASNSWKCTISNLAKLDSAGRAIAYTIKERTVPSGYTQQTGSVTTADGTTATVTNTLQTKNITVTKTWSDLDNKFSTRPASIIFDAFIGNGSTSVGNCTANASNSWKCTISNLAKLDSAGKAISYTIKERTVPSGYTQQTGSVTTADGTTATVTNTLQTKNITVTKTWVDQDNKFSTRPASIIFDAFIGNGTSSVGNCTANASNSWKCTISNLAVLNSSGQVISYTIKERTVPSGYDGTTATVATQAGTAAEIKNTLKTKNITVTKVWDDQNNKFNTRPASIIFDAFIGNGTSSVGNCTANASSAWKCTISNLAILDSSGQVISYTVKERTVPFGYTGTTAAVNSEAGVAAEIKNTLQVKDITVSKIWEDRENFFSTRPESIIFDVFIGSGNVSMGNCTANAANSWKCTISNLAKLDASGKPISYTVKERVVPAGYESTTATVNTEAGVTAEIKNTLITISINVEKQWDDDDNRDNYRVSSISFDIYADNVKQVGSPYTISADTNWKTTVSGLPKINSSGNNIVYSVKEIR